MEDNKRTLSIDVGGRLRALREERKISMRNLAKHSGLSANALSMIERGLTSPSVSTLMKLAQALEVPVVALFREEPVKQKIVLCREEDRRVIAIKGGKWEALGTDRFDGKMAAYLATLKHGSRSGERGMHHSGYEFIFCLEGKLEYEVEGETYVLEAGDSLSFTSNAAHHWRNLSEGTSRSIIVVSCFGEEEYPGVYHGPAETDFTAE